MAQYSPAAAGLDVGDYAAAWDRSCFFGPSDLSISVQSVDVYLGGGASYRVARYASSTSSTSAGATLVYDFGVEENTGLEGFVTISAPPGIVIDSNMHPIVVVRQIDSTAICGTGSYPNGDAVMALRAYNENDPITSPFPETAYTDDTSDQSFRVPYVRLNYSVSGSGPQIVSINSGTIVSGSQNNNLTVSGFDGGITLLDIGGLEITPVGSGDNYTFDDPGFIDGQIDPGFGSLAAVASSGTETSSAFNVTRTLSASLTAVVMSTLSDDPNSIGQASQDRGLTISAGDTLYNSTGLTVYNDSTISDADDGTHNIWHRDADTNVMTLIILKIVGG